ncbi:nitroreductase family protein [Petrachloros mirabilis]
MKKPADTQYPIVDVMRERWSPRAFDERLVEPEKLRGIFEAARWAPSCNNAQPWRFLVATKDHPADHQRFLGWLLEGNRKWAFRAPVLVLSVAKMTFDDGSPNRHAFHDVGLSTENLILQATAHDLVAHPMAGFQIQRARAESSIPPDFEPVAMIAIGYPGDPALLPDYLREREYKPRSRQLSTTFVFSGEWHRTAHFLK